MSHKKGLHTLNNCMKDQIILMGGDTVLLAVVFQETLQVLPIGTRANEVEACIKYLYLWPQIIKLSLNKNIRGHLIRDSTDGQFSKLRLQIGDEKYPESEGEITLPSELGILITIFNDLTEKYIKASKS